MVGCTTIAGPEETATVSATPGFVLNNLLHILCAPVYGKCINTGAGWVGFPRAINV